MIWTDALAVNVTVAAVFFLVGFYFGGHSFARALERAARGRSADLDSERIARAFKQRRQGKTGSR